MPPKARLSKLTNEDQQTLIAVVTEMKNRGLPIPIENIRQIKHDWSTDADGYFIKHDGKNFIPNSDQQGAFVHSTARFSALFSGRGGGKTASGAQKALMKIQRGESGSVMNPDFENFKYSTWPELREWIPWEMVVPSQRYRVDTEWQPHEPFTISFMNKTRMICKGLKNPDSARGPNMNWLWYDEAGRDDTGLGWKIAVAGVRVGKDPQAWITTTPRGMDHWIYRFFVKQEIPEEVIEAFRQASTYYGKNIPLVESFQISISDNKVNLDPLFYAQMLSMYTGWMKDQELDGQFVEGGGVLGHSEWFIGKIVLNNLENVLARVRYWDLAASEKKLVGKRKGDDPDYTVGTLLAQAKDRYEIEHQVSARVEWHNIKQMIVDTAKNDGASIPIRIEEEGGAGGKNLVAEVVSIPELAAYNVEGHRPEGDKVMRAQSWFSKAALGIVYLKQGEWNQPFLDQLSGFPLSSHDDLIDSVSGCFATIGKKQWKTIEFMKV